MIDLSQRVLEGELMDAPDLAADVHQAALTGLNRVNWFSGTGGVLSKKILAAFPRWSKQLRILDLACGGGDVTLALSHRLQSARLSVHVDAWDRSDTAIDFAKQRVAKLQNQGLADSASAVHFQQRDVFALAEIQQYDVVMCTLFLHHLDRPAALELLRKMYAATRGIVLIDDLRRTMAGYRLAQLGCYALTRSHIVHVDGPLSVRAAFTESEVEELSREAGLPRPEISRHWPQRFMATWRQKARS